MDIQLFRKKNTKCCIRDSALCQWMGKNDCSECYVLELPDKEQEEALRRWEVTQSLLPEGIDSLTESETCHFCVKDPLKRTRYATVDLAHPEPESTKGMFFGLGKKVRTKIGSLLPVSIACCDRCRRAYANYDIIKYTIPVLLVLIGILLIVLPGTAAVLTSIGEFSSYVLLIVLLALGILLGRILSSAYVRRKSGEVYLNVFDIPLVGEMRDRGWFLLQEDSEVTRLIFSKKKFNISRQIKFGNETPGETPDA